VASGVLSFSECIRYLSLSLRYPELIKAGNIVNWEEHGKYQSLYGFLRKFTDIGFLIRLPGKGFIISEKGRDFIKAINEELSK